jgi:hypothetical protein
VLLAWITWLLLVVVLVDLTLQEEAVLEDLERVQH